ncbi:MAG: MarR family winged helix-turn-helix transcriptional regulator [Pseudorhodoplanes sp.]
MKKAKRAARIPSSPRRRRTANPHLTITLPDLVRSGEDIDFREMISLMYATLGRLQTMRRTLAHSLGLGSAEFAVVMALLRIEDVSGVSIRRIADDLYVAAANVTVTISKLEEMGWVIKSSDPTDSRALAIRLTPAARQRLSAFADRLHFVNDVWFQGTTRTELKAVVSFFRNLISQYEPALSVAREFANVLDKDGPAG